MARFPQRKERRNPLVVLVGPTSSGKSALAVELARRFDGEIVSADSRQVYCGLNLGSGKISRAEMMGIPHHLLSVASPRRNFTVSQFQKQAREAILEIQARNRIPFLVGGSRLYVASVTDNLVFPRVKPDAKLRERLEKETASALFSHLKKLDPERARTIERTNKRRLVRALEIILKTGDLVPRVSKTKHVEDQLILGIKRKEGELKKDIASRLTQRLKRGMIGEVRNLRDMGLSFKRLESFGLEYRHIARHLQGKISKQEMTEQILQDSARLAKLQLKWYQKDPRVHWVTTKKEAELLVADFLKQKSSR